MRQQATGSFNTPQVPDSSTGLEPLAPIRYPWQASERVQPLTTTPNITQATASGNTPGTSSGMAPGVATGRAPGVVTGSNLDKFHGISLPGNTPGMTPGTTPYSPYTNNTNSFPGSTSDIIPESISSTATGIAPHIFPDTTPGSCNTARMDLVAAAPRSNNAPSATKMPRQVASPRQQPILQSQKRKASIIVASPNTHQGTTRPKSTTPSGPLHQHMLQHDDHTNGPQQQVDLSPAMPVSGVHQPAPHDTAAQSSGKKRRKKLLQQCVLPFQTTSGEPVTAPAKPPVPAKSRAKKPHKQPVSLICCVT